MPEADGSLGSTDIAILSARVDVARVGASRVGFYPEDVEGAGTSEPGEYIWKEYFPPSTQWTLLTEGRVCGQRPVASFTMTGSTPVVNPPVAGFTWELTTFLDVQFTDTSTGDISSWDWDFGDGSAHGTDQNPLHTYPDYGSYTVILTVTGPGGSDDDTQIVELIGF